MRFVAALVIIILSAQATSQKLSHVRLRAPHAKDIASILLGEGFDVLRGSIAADTLELVVNRDEEQALRNRGFEVTTLAIGRPFDHIQAERQASAATPDGTVPAGYSNLADVLARAQAHASNAPDICAFVNLTQKYAGVPGVSQTYEGRDLFGVKISDNVNVDEDEPTLLIVSCHHSRELVTPEIALTAIENLTSIYSQPTHPDHAAVVDAVDNYETWVLPICNPDGYHEVFVGDNLWRKNRRIFAQGIGVDLNRNYPPGWSSACAGETSVTSIFYRGPSSASEAETRTILALQDDKQFSKVIDFHSQGQLVNYSYGTCWQHPLENFLRNEATALAVASGYATANLPPANGMQYMNPLMRFGSLSFLVETHTSWQPSYTSALTEAQQVWPGILHVFARPITVSGHVTDASTGLPLAAEVRFGLPYVHGETSTSGGLFGRYQMFLPVGAFTATFSSPGYIPQRIPFTVSSPSTSVVLNVALSPETCQEDLGFQGPGFATATLCGTGLHDSETSEYGVEGAPDTAPGVMLISGSGGSNVQVLGGVLASFGAITPGTGYLVQAPVVTNGEGRLNLVIAGTSTLLDLVVQSVFLDVGTPGGLTMTNAILARFGR